MTKAQQTEQWWAFRAHNRETLYGFGTAGEASKYAEHLNAGRDYDQFAKFGLSDDETKIPAVALWGFNLDDTLRDLASQ